MRKTRTIILATAAVVGLGVSTAFASEGIDIKRNVWSFGGLTGQYDKEQLQRGFKVYKEVCSACHGLTRIAFRNLAQPGGPEFPEETLKAYVAENFEVDQPPNDDGEVKKGPAKLSDRFPPLYPNEKAARAAQNGALPPDLSIIARARGVSYNGPWYLHPFAMAKDIVTGYQEGGADYIVALMTGYRKVPSYVRDEHGHLKPAGTASGPNTLKCVSIQHLEGKPDECVKLAEGMHYNAAFPGHQVAMAFPFEGSTPDDPRVKYDDGTKPTIEQYAKDVAAFLSWAADPTLDQRKQMGWLVMIYLLITAVLLYIAKRRLWSGIPH